MMFMHDKHGEEITNGTFFWYQSEPDFKVMACLIDGVVYWSDYCPAIPAKDFWREDRDSKISEIVETEEVKDDNTT